MKYKIESGNLTKVTKAKTRIKAVKKAIKRAKKGTYLGLLISAQSTWESEQEAHLFNTITILKEMGLLEETETL